MRSHPNDDLGLGFLIPIIRSYAEYLTMAYGVRLFLALLFGVEVKVMAMARLICQLLNTFLVSLLRLMLFPLDNNNNDVTSQLMLCRSNNNNWLKAYSSPV